nr:ADP-ribosyl cyclase/cyclic ADP-ribose hydrolase-like [Lytechinus pictus]
MRHTERTGRVILVDIAAVVVVMSIIGDPSTGRMMAAGTTTVQRVNYSDIGTDPDLREIFIGRCADFKAGKVNPTVDLNELRMKNCTKLWELFSSTFKYREACDVNQTMYEEFVNAAAITIPANKSNFWDGWGIYDTVHAYAKEGRRAWSLEYTLVGYLINNLKFCGQKNETGFRYDSCPGMDECGFATGCADAFWAEASVYFAKQAKGHVRVLFDSNREGGAFQNENSYFAQFELINMRPEAVDNVNIYLITMVDQETGDNCSSSSIQQLTTILTQRGISYTCHDQPRDVLHLLCTDEIASEECLLQKDILESPTDVALPLTTGSASRTRSTIGVGCHAFIVISIYILHSILHYT